MNSIQKTLAAVAVAALSFAVSPPADARSIGAWAGKPQDSHALPCFTENYMSVTNACSQTFIWEVPLVVESATPFNPMINVVAAGSTDNVVCQTMALFQDSTGGGTRTTPRVGPSQANVAMNIQPGFESVPSGGTLTVACWVGPLGRINSVNW